MFTACAKRGVSAEGDALTIVFVKPFAPEPSEAWVPLTIDKAIEGSKAPPATVYALGTLTELPLGPEFGSMSEEGLRRNAMLMRMIQTVMSMEA
jgi:hypothetical protein